MNNIDKLARSQAVERWLQEIVNSITSHDCSHPHWQLCERPQKQFKSYRVQCLRCGRCSSAVARAELLKRGINLASLPAYDETRYDLFWDAQERRRAEERAEANREWWAEYNAYLESDEWKNLRALVLRRANGICEGCGKRPPQQVHHLTYKRVFQEMLFDLVAVCCECHEALHLATAAAEEAA